MSRFLSVLSASLALTTVLLSPTLAQEKRYPVGVIEPASSKGELTPTKHAKTNLKILQTSTRPQHSGAQPLIGTGAYGTFSPKDIRGFYKIPAAKVGHGFIVIVDAFDCSTLTSDFNTFSAAYGLPQETGNGRYLEIFAPYGVTAGSANGTGWDLEACLDTQWAHAVAPNATIVLVEATTNSLTDLYNAVYWGHTAGPAAEVSMSWSSGEGAASATTEGILTSGVGINFASTGDSGAFYALYGNYESYPASSPNVCGAGGTTSITSDSVPGHLITTMGWEEGGGGPSAVFGQPSYQAGVAGTISTARCLPDLSANADPNTPVGVINTSLYGSTYWFFVGGTSESSPILAAIQNDSGNSYASTFAFLQHVYANLDTAGYYNDVKVGWNGFLAGDDYDMVTGVGTPLGKGAVIPGM